MSREVAADLHAELGYRPAGQRELSLREWASLRGDPGEVAPTPQAFAALVNRLRVKKWQKANPEKRRALSLRYALSPRGLAVNAGNARKRRRARFVAAALVIACADCGVEFCEVKPRGGVPRRYCSYLCGRRAVQHARRRAAGQRSKSCGVCGAPGHNARRHR